MLKAPFVVKVVNTFVAPSSPSTTEAAVRPSVLALALALLIPLIVPDMAALIKRSVSAVGVKKSLELKGTVVVSVVLPSFVAVKLV